MQPTQGTEALRAMISLRQCWHENNEIYLSAGCLDCGSAASYLIYFTNREIQKLMLDFIACYSCQISSKTDFLAFENFAPHYQELLNQLESCVIRYAFTQTTTVRHLRFEEVESIFERPSPLYCLSA